MCFGAQKHSSNRAVHSRLPSMWDACPSVVLELITMGALGGQLAPWSYWPQGHAPMWWLQCHWGWVSFLCSGLCHLVREAWSCCWPADEWGWFPCGWSRSPWGDRTWCWPAGGWSYVHGLGWGRGWCLLTGGQSWAIFDKAVKNIQLGKVSVIYGIEKIFAHHVLDKELTSQI